MAIERKQLVKYLLIYGLIGLILITILACLLVFLLTRPNVTYATNNITDNVIIIAEDDESLKYLEEDLEKLDSKRDVYAEISEKTIAAGARGVILNYRFMGHKEGHEKADKLFVDTINRHNNIYLGMSLTYYKETVNDELLKLIEKSSITVEDSSTIDFAPVTYPFCETLMDDLYNVSSKVSIINLSNNSYYDITKQALLFSYKDHYYPFIAFRAAIDQIEKDTGNKVSKIILNNENELIVGKKHYPLDKSGSLKIRWYGPVGTFKQIPLHRVYQSILKEKKGQKPLINMKDLFNDRLVIIGNTSKTFYDFRSTPVGSKMSSSEYLATIYQNLISEY